MTHNPVRPWRNIERRRSRRIHVGQVAVGGDAPISVQTMTNTLTTDVAATIAQVQACADAGADIVRVSVPDEASSRALREIVRESPVPIVADIHFHYRRAIEAAEAGAACLQDQPRQHRLEGAGARGDPRRPRPRLLDAHRRQRRQPREAPAGEIRRALPGGDDRERPRPHPHPRGQRLPRVQDQREGLRRLPRRRRLPGPRRGDRRPDPPRDHRGRRHDHRHGQVGDRPRQPALDGHRRHPARQPLRRPGRGGARSASRSSRRSACATAASTSSPARPAPGRGST